MQQLQSNPSHLFITTQSLFPAQSFQKVYQQNQLFQNYLNIDVLTDKVNQKHQSALIRNRNVISKRNLLHKAITNLKNYQQSRQRMIDKLLKENGIRQLQANILALQSSTQFMKKRYNDLLDLSSQNQIKQKYINQDIKQLKQRARKKMRGNLQIKANCAQKSSRSNTQSARSLKNTKSLSSTKLKSSYKQSKQTSTPFKTPRLPMSYEIKSKILKKDQLVQNIYKNTSRSCTQEKIISNRIHPLIQQCFKIGFKDIQSKVSNEKDFTSGIGLEIIKKNRSNKKILKQNNIQDKRLGTMLYELLKNTIQEDDTFIVDWQSFAGFNSKQILGMAACTGMQKILNHLRTL